MRRLGLAALVAVVIVLQLGFVAGLRPLGVVPNLILVLVVLIGLLGTATSALAVAVVGGLLLDLTSGADFGLRLGLLLLLALVTGLVHRAGLQLGGPLLAIGIVALATIVGQVAVLAGLVGAVVTWPLGLLLTRLWWEVVLNSALVVVLLPLVKLVVPPESLIAKLGR